MAVVFVPAPPGCRVSGASQWLSPDRALIALSLALYDHVAIFYLSSGYSNLALAKYAFLFILLAMSTLLMRRVFRSINTAKRFRVRLQSRLDRAGALISRFHDEREKKRIQEAEMGERMRLLQEMHDGVGAHLVVLHCMVRNAESSRLDMENQLSQATLALRDSLDTLQGEPQTAKDDPTDKYIEKILN